MIYLLTTYLASALGLEGERRAAGESLSEEAPASRRYGADGGGTFEDGTRRPDRGPPLGHEGDAPSFVVCKTSSESGEDLSWRHPAEYLCTRAISGCA